MCCDRSLATERDLQLKQQAWDNFLITTHWPSHNVTVFPGLGNSESYYAANADAASDQADEQQHGAEQGAADGQAAEAAGMSRTVADQQGAAEPRSGENADDTAVDAAAAGIASIVLGSTSAAEAPEGDAQQQKQQLQQQQQQDHKKLSHWEARAADGDVKALLAPLRTRHRVDDAAVRNLAGVEPYEPSEVWRKQPLVDVYGAHPEVAQ
jgi:hypothetical protein